MTEKRVYMSMVFAALCWSGAPIAGKMAITEFPPVSLTFIRFALALPFLFFLLYLREPRRFMPSGYQWKPLILLGITGPFIYHVLFFICLKYTSAINTALISTFMPIMTTLIAVLVLKEKITRLQSVGIFISFTGVFLTVTGGDLSMIADFSFNAGDLIMLAAICFWAAYMAANRRVMERYKMSPLFLTAYTFFVCTVFSIPFALLERPFSFLERTTSTGWLAIFYMTLFPTVLAYLIQNIAIHRIGAPRSTTFNNLTPIFTIFFSTLILGEPFSLFKLICAAVIISGVLLVSGPGGNEEPVAHAEEKSMA